MFHSPHPNPLPEGEGNRVTPKSPRARVLSRFFRLAIVWRLRLGIIRLLLIHVSDSGSRLRAMESSLGHVFPAPLVMLAKCLALVPSAWRCTASTFLTFYQSVVEAYKAHLRSRRRPTVCSTDAPPFGGSISTNPGRRADRRPALLLTRPTCRIVGAILANPRGHCPTGNNRLISTHRQTTCNRRVSVRRPAARPDRRRTCLLLGTGTPADNHLRRRLAQPRSAPPTQRRRPQAERPTRVRSNSTASNSGCENLAPRTICWRCGVRTPIATASSARWRSRAIPNMGRNASFRPRPPSRCGPCKTCSTKSSNGAADGSRRPAQRIGLAAEDSGHLATFWCREVRSGG